MPTRKTTEQFIEEAVKIHGNLYDYSYVKYINTHEHVKIICNCGFEFHQAPVHHLHGSGCLRCYGKVRRTPAQYIQDAIRVHGYKYDYKETVFSNSTTKVKIFCNQHNEFFYQNPINHLAGYDCPKCAIENSKKTLEQFIIDAKSVHGDRYDYSDVNYVGSNDKVIIKCESHGNFMQSPSSHLTGSGCPSCKSSHGENKIKLILKNLGLTFDPQYSDPTCKYKNRLYFDFYIYDVVNWILEFQGEQHYKIASFSNDYDTNVSNYELIKIRDNIKRKWCLDNNIPLLEIHYKDKDIEKTIREFRDNIERMK